MSTEKQEERRASGLGRMVRNTLVAFIAVGVGLHAYILTRPDEFDFKAGFLPVQVDGMKGQYQVFSEDSGNWDYSFNLELTDGDKTYFIQDSNSSYVLGWSSAGYDYGREVDRIVISNSGVLEASLNRNKETESLFRKADSWLEKAHAQYEKEVAKLRNVEGEEAQLDQSIDQMIKDIPVKKALDLDLVQSGMPAPSQKQNLKTYYVAFYRCHYNHDAICSDIPESIRITEERITCLRDLQTAIARGEQVNADGGR